MIITEKYSQLAPEVKSILSRLVEEEFGHVAFVQERVWAQPDWVLSQAYQPERLTLVASAFSDLLLPPVLRVFILWKPMLYFARQV